MTFHRPVILRLLVVAITFLTFARLTKCEFTWWDDQDTIHQNPLITSPNWDTLKFYWTTADEHKTMGLYVPVTYTVWAGLAKISQLDHPDAQGLTLNAQVFHTANVIIHCLTALLVFQLFWRLFRQDLAACFGALLFALHPVQVESVGWVSGTKDLLCGMFSISALLMYLPLAPSRCLRVCPEDPDVSAIESGSSGVPSDTGLGTTGPRLRYLLGILFFILAMLSKPTAVVVPLMAATISIFFLNRTAWQTFISLIPWFILMVPCLIWTKLVQPATWSSPLPLWTRPAVALDALAFYFCKIAWPIHLCIDYGRTPQAIVAGYCIYYSWMLPIAVAAILFFNRRNWRTLIAAAFLFVIPLLPVLGFVGFEFQQISTTADHYLYLPMLGLAMGFTWMLCRIHSPLRWGVSAVILVLLLLRTVLQEPYWQDTRSLFGHALDLNPASVVCSDGMGFLTGREARRSTDPLAAQHLFDQSIRWYENSVHRAPDSVPSLYNLALDYKAVGRLESGRQQLRRIVHLQPQLTPALRTDPIALAHLLYDYPDVPDAIDWLTDVVRRDPGNHQAMVLLLKAKEKQ